MSFGSALGDPSLADPQSPGRLFVGPSDLRVLELKTVADIPLTLPAFNLPHLRRLTWNAMRSPVASLPRTLDLLRNLLGTPSLHHCNVVLPTYPNESTDLAAVLAEAAPRLHSLSLAAISDETKPLRYNVSGALPLMVSLRSLHLSAAFLAANTSSQFAFLRSQPRLHALRIHWDHKRARDDGEWSWLQLATGLKESSVMRRQKLVVTVGISGPLRAYDIAQRASKTAMMDAGVENVELWLEYWNEPFRAY